MRKLKILFAGGGTAGHIFPIISVVRELRRLGLNWKFFYIGPRDDFSSLLLSQEGIEIKTVLAGKIRRYVSFKSVLENIFDLLIKMPLGFLQSAFIVFFTAPDLIFSKGGYGSISPAISGWLLRIPVLLHESDVSPGLANRIVGKFAPRVFVSFPVAQTEYFSEKKMIVVGNPIRRELLSGSKDKAGELFNLSGEKPVIVVIGGSQGSQKINDTILAVLPQILSEFELIHQTGEKNFEEVSAEAKVIAGVETVRYFHPIGFFKEIELREAYAAADVVLSRAGSGAIFEIASCGKPSILIPLANAAQSHQIKNAYAYSLSGAAIVIEEDNLTPHFLLEKIKYLFANPETLQKMSEKAKVFARPDAAKTIAQYIMDSFKA